MSLSAAAAKFGVDTNANRLPSHSEGKDFINKGKGKGGRDFESNAELNDFRSSGKGEGGKGFRRRDDEPSRADQGDWFSRDKPSGGGGFRSDRRGNEDTQAERDGDWRGGAGRNEDGPRFGRDRRDRDDDRSERPRLNLKPRSRPTEEGQGSGSDGERAEPKPGKYVPPSVRKRMEEEKGGDKDEDGFETLKTRSSGAYVPAAKRREEEERKKKEEEKHKKEQDAQRRKQQEEQEKLEAEKRRKIELKERKEAEAAAKREELKKSRPQRFKEAAKAEIQVDEEKLQELTSKCADSIEDAKGIKALAKSAPDMFTEEELKTTQPITAVLEPLMKYCRRKEDEQVFSAVNRFAPLLTSLIDAAEVHRFKVKVLVAAQALAYQMGLPRLSPATALVEAIFDGLYQAEVIEEDYFFMWRDYNDDTPGKISAMFQLDYFLAWLKDPDSIKDKDGNEGEEEEEEDGEGDEEESEAEDEEEEEE